MEMPAAGSSTDHGTRAWADQTRKRRSRAGCFACKQHKKKCDEQHPTCSRCAVVERDCVYPSTTGRRPASTPLNPSAGPPATARPPNPSPSRLASISSETHLPSSNSTLSPAAGLLSPSPHEYLTAHPSFFETPTGTPFNLPDLDLADLDLPEDLSLLEPFWPGAVSEPVLRTPPSQEALPGDLGYDLTLFRAFSNTSSWRSTSDPDDTDDEALMTYFREFVASTVVARNEECPTQSYFLQLANASKLSGREALRSALLCISATHLQNVATICNDVGRQILFGRLASRHRTAVLRSLRISAAQEDLDIRETKPAIMQMLTLSLILTGDCDMVDSILRRFEAYLDGHPSNPPKNMLDVPTFFFALYSTFRDIALGLTVDYDQLWTERFQHDLAKQTVANDLINDVVGISVGFLSLFVKVFNRTLETVAIEQACLRSPGDEELDLWNLEINFSCQEVLAELNDPVIWEVQWQAGVSDRTRMGHLFYRLAIQVMILVDLFHQKSENNKVQRCVCEMAELSAEVPAGTEVGLLWPWLIVASEAQVEGDHREKLMDFVRRCRWKGAAAPRLAQEIVEKVWDARSRDDKSSSTWRLVLKQLGSPIII